MTPLMEVLFTYACENPTAQQTKEYHLKSAKYNRLAEQAQQEVNRLLSEEGQQRFTDYISAESRLQLLELEAMFRVGLSIGLELSRL